MDPENLIPTDTVLPKITTGIDTAGTEKFMGRYQRARSAIEEKDHVIEDCYDKHLLNPRRWSLDKSKLPTSLSEQAEALIEKHQGSFGDMLTYTAEARTPLPRIIKPLAIALGMGDREHPRSNPAAVWSLALRTVLMPGSLAAMFLWVMSTNNAWAVFIAVESVILLYLVGVGAMLSDRKVQTAKLLPLSGPEAQLLNDAMIDRTHNQFRRTPAPMCETRPISWSDDKHRYVIALTTLRRIDEHPVFNNELFIGAALRPDLDEEALAISTTVDSMTRFARVLERNTPAGDNTTAVEVRAALSHYRDALEQARAAMDIRIGALLSYLDELEAMVPLFEALDTAARLCAPTVMSALDDGLCELVVNEVLDEMAAESTRARIDELDEIRARALARIEVLAAGRADYDLVLAQPLHQHTD